MLLHACGNVVLQAGSGGNAVFLHQSEFPDLGLAVGVCLPLVAGAFVAAYMYVFAGEELCDLTQHVLQELHGLLAAHVEHLLGNAPYGPYFVGLGLAAGATELGVRCQSRLHVAGEVDFRDDGDTALSRICNDVPDLVFGVVAAVAYAVVGVPVAAHHRAVAEGADLGEAGIFVDFDPPSLVFAQVPVEAVELENGHHVKHLLDLIDAEEMPAAVKHHAAVGEAGCVFDLAAGENPL